MADVDISAEAVERRADELLGWLTGPDSGQNDGITETVRVLRALRAALTQAEAERDKGRTAPRDLVWSVWIDHPSTQDIINMDAFDRARAALGDNA